MIQSAPPAAAPRTTPGFAPPTKTDVWDGPSAHALVRLVLTVGGLVIAGFWWLDTAGGSVVGMGASVTALGRLLGLMAAYLVLTQVLLMARVPWFERAVGLNRLAAWHRGLGTGVVVLLVSHTLVIVEGYSLTAHRATLGEGWTVLSTYPDMLKALVGTGLFLLVGATSGPRLRRRMSYEAWYWLHLSAYVAIALTFFHQVSTGADFVGSDLQHRAFRLIWTAGYLAVAAAVVWWRLAQPVRGWWQHRLLVEAVVPEADGVVSVHVRGRDTHLLGRAGQFLSVRFLTPGHFGTAHPYSLSAPPRGGRLRFTVKAAGDHTAALSELRPGVPVLAEGPFGRFTADQATRHRVALIAGGSGIAPIRALAEELTTGRGTDGRVRFGSDVVVLYRASAAEDLALAREFDALARAGRIEIRYLIGKRRDLGFDPLDPARLGQLLPDLATRDVFTCGPTGMVVSVQDSLRQLGVPRRQVHVEEFDL
ncbi:MAG TPA: ferredoxin reductase family protein [Frankiaceae bacterium]|nr:ferredoxin reductase family protein [Frankiaceae bacterium]